MEERLQKELEFLKKFRDNSRVFTVRNGSVNVHGRRYTLYIDENSHPFHNYTLSSKEWTTLSTKGGKGLLEAVRKKIEGTQQEFRIQDLYGKIFELENRDRFIKSNFDNEYSYALLNDYRHPATRRTSFSTATTRVFYRDDFYLLQIGAL